MDFTLLLKVPIQNYSMAKENLHGSMIYEMNLKGCHSMNFKQSLTSRQILFPQEEEYQYKLCFITLG